MMHSVKMSDEGEQLLGNILSIWPKIMRERRKEKILNVLSLIANKHGALQVSREQVLEAVKLVVPKSYDPIFHAMKDYEKFKRLIIDPFESIEAYNRIPVKAKRWKRVRRKKAGKNSSRKYVIAFCASPRKNGNTDLLINEALRGAKDAGARVEKIMLQRLTMKFCVGCRRCKDRDFSGMCTVKDDMDTIYEKIKQANTIIIGFPIYTGRESAQLSTFFDRWDCFERYQLKPSLKPGRTAMVIGTWGYPCVDTYDHIIENIMVVLNLHKIETIEAISACGFEGILHGLDEKGRGVIARYPRELRKAYDAGAALVQ